MILEKAMTTGKDKSNEIKAVALLSVRETRMSYFNSIEDVLEALSIVTVGVVKKMHNEITVTVEGNNMTTGRRDITLHPKLVPKLVS